MIYIEIIAVIFVVITVFWFGYAFGRTQENQLLTDIICAFLKKHHPNEISVFNIFLKDTYNNHTKVKNILKETE